jgi:hypothetical protein
MNIFIPKRDGLMALVLVAALLSGSAGYYYWGGAQQARAAKARPMPSLPDIQVPENKVLVQMAGLRTRLNRLAYPRAAGRGEAQLGLFGYVPAATDLRRTKGGRDGVPRKPALFDYELSFALCAGAQQLCLLDGKLYTRGGRLPDGGQIVTIEPERVLIEKKPLQRWIYLQVPPLGGETPTEARAPGATPNEEG